MKTRLITLLITLFVLQFTFAQVKLGVKLGVLATDVNVKASTNLQDLEIPTSRTINFSAGATLEYEFMEDILGIRTAIEYAQKGYNVDLNKFKQMYNDIQEIKGDWRVALQYIQMPVNLYYKMGNFNLNAGPYMGYALGGLENYNLDITLDDGSNFAVDGSTDMIPVNGEADIDLNDIQNADTPLLNYFNQLDFGINVGFGYTIKDVQINVQYQQGLTNLTPDLVNEPDFNPSDLLSRNNVLSLDLIYFFPLSKK